MAVKHKLEVGTTIKELLLQATKILPKSPTVRLDAEVLLAHVLGKSRSFIYAYPQLLISKFKAEVFHQLLAKRALGLPIAYLTGTKEFWSLPLKVSQETLIPRPETERLVELTLESLSTKKEATVLDLGTGSGAIALALAKEAPDWRIKACDISHKALSLAQKNAEQLQIKNIYFFYSDWFKNLTLELSFDAIVANPPYLRENDSHLKTDLRYEPALALVSGKDGLRALEHIIKHGLARLKPGGLLLLEHGFDQKQAVASMLKDYGYGEIQSWRDWQGHDRVMGGKRINS